MDDVLKKRLSIGIAIGCLVLAAGIIVKTNFSGSSSGGAAGPIHILCVNPKCGQTFDFSEKEFNDMVSKSTGTGSGGMPMLTEAPVFKCPKCNANSAYVAMKCEKCGNLFVPNYQNPVSYDKCPKCGFSKVQQIQGQK
ncbi:MAG: hypothetical protein WC770_04895 [Phycisphaerae bacterium]|jgi:DNA-directed RNA polymerase subunit M/transcription elongation factor TFIIS